MKLTIEIEMDNAAFEGDAGVEAMRILRKLQIDGTDPNWSKTLMDTNGNKVGRAEITD